MERLNEDVTILREIALAQSAFTNLNKVVTQLIEKIAPVCSVSVPVETKAGEEPPRSESAVFLLIEDLKMHMACLAHTVDEAIQRVEL